MNDLGLTQQKVAERLGKSRPYIIAFKSSLCKFSIMANSIMSESERDFTIAGTSSNPANLEVKKLKVIND
jgi:transcriptional regulator with XRE-family HTH domain